MYFLVDPMVLCLPEPTATPNQIEYFFQYLNNWSEFIRKGQDNKFYMTEECCQVSASKFPYPESIRGYLQNVRGTLDANTVSSACSRILQNFPSWPFLEEEVGLPKSLVDSLVDSDTMCLDPDLIRRTPSEIAKPLQESFGYVAYAKKIANHDIASALYFLTYPINGSNKIEIGVTVLIEEGVHEVKTGLHEVETDLPIVESPEDLLKHKSLIDIWENTEQAIEWAKGEMNINKGSSPYTAGPGFNQSIENCQFSTHSNRLEQCFKKIARLLSGEQIHSYELRTGKGPNNPQQETKVDGETWKACRLRITEGRGSAYRLHYWENDNKYIFSDIVNKNNFNISPINQEIVSQIN